MIRPIYISNSKTETGEPAATLSGQISTLLEAEQALIEIKGVYTRLKLANQNAHYANKLRQRDLVGQWVRCSKAEAQRSELHKTL